MNQPQLPEGVTAEDLMIGSWIDKESERRPRAAFDMTLEDAFAEGVRAALLKLMLKGTISLSKEYFERIVLVESEDFYGMWELQDGPISTVTLARSYGMGLNTGNSVSESLIEESLSPFDQSGRSARERWQGLSEYLGYEDSVDCVKAKIEDSELWIERIGAMEDFEESLKSKCLSNHAKTLVQCRADLAELQPEVA